VAPGQAAAFAGTSGASAPALFGNEPEARPGEPGQAQFGSTGSASWEAAVGSSTAGDQGYDEYEDDEPRHPYTWLHYLILVAVAFVLGLLIWELVLGPRGGDVNSQGGSVSITQLAGAPTATYQGVQ
jgi:hypothetical protein